MSLIEGRLRFFIAIGSAPPEPLPCCSLARSLLPLPAMEMLPFAVRAVLQPSPPAIAVRRPKSYAVRGGTLRTPSIAAEAPVVDAPWWGEGVPPSPWLDSCWRERRRLARRRTFLPDSLSATLPSSPGISSRLVEGIAGQQKGLRRPPTPCSLQAGLRSPVCVKGAPAPIWRANCASQAAAPTYLCASWRHGAKLSDRRVRKGQIASPTFPLRK